MPVLAFDLYGTLVDTQGLVAEIAPLFCHKSQQQAMDFSRLWRSKQLEYTFRRSLMQDYVDFDVCTQQALRYCLQHYALSSPHAEQQLLQAYQRLPAFTDAIPALSVLQRQIPCYVFSNGTQKSVNNLLKAAQLRPYFQDIISADKMQCFKPSPRLYHHFAVSCNTAIEQCYLVSANTFDLLGAAKVGMPTIWLRREQQQLDPWGIKPTHTIQSLSHIHDIQEFTSLPPQ